ncbi:MAG: hypothetical protein GY774_13340 [Planctomycetes bacterium]|nr:hypothetical protein [Planctomycetota bacterium]
MEGNRYSDSPRHHGIPGSIVFSFLAICLIMAIVGCKSTADKSTMMKQLKVKKFTSHELQVRINEFVTHFAHLVEASSDQIMSRTTDTSIRRQALIWKIYAIPACKAAATSSDPLMAFIDTWAFVLQMNDYFESGGGKEAFGEFQPIAITTSRSLELQLLKGIKQRALPEGFEQAVNFVDNWVLEHPIKTQFFTRDSTMPLLIDIYRANPKGAFASVGSIDQGIRSVADRIAFLSDSLSREIRWQAEYLMETTVSGQKMEETLNNVNTLVKSVDRMARVVEQSPEIIERERTAVFAEIREERKEVLESIDKQRSETIQVLDEEILQVLKVLHEERIATVEDVSKRLEEKVESLFWRTFLCLAGLAGVGLACGAGLIWIKARSNRTPPTAT